MISSKIIVSLFEFTVLKSLGFESGIGQELSEQLGAVLIAPKVPTNVKQIETQIDEEGIHFEVEYDEENSAAVYVAGQEQ